MITVMGVLKAGFLSCFLIVCPAKVLSRNGQKWQGQRSFLFGTTFWGNPAQSEQEVAPNTLSLALPISVLGGQI
jgi:hypothetical protein